MVMLRNKGFRSLLKLALLFIVVSLLFSACTQPELTTDQAKIKVVASTTIVAEFVAQVGGDYVELITLIPADADPHTFEPRPQDIAAISKAQIVFINGFGLEESLIRVLTPNLHGKLVEVSADVPKLELVDIEAGHTDNIHSGWDPHTWMDPNNVIQWIETIDRALSELDPAHSDYFHANAVASKASLVELDKWIQDQVSVIPADHRKLVSDHAFFGYFAKRYDFEQAGMVNKSFSTSASPSAQDISQLQEEIQKAGIPAIFVSNTANPKIAEQLAEDLGIKIVPIYSGSLSQPNGEADTYQKYMQFDVTQIVNALK
jgi:manganese/iron transport system substrate-binding protein